MDNKKYLCSICREWKPMEEMASQTKCKKCNNGKNTKKSGKVNRKHDTVSMS